MGNILGRGARVAKRPVDPAKAAQALAIRENEAARIAQLKASAPAEWKPAVEGSDDLQKLVRAIKSRPLDLYKDAKGPGAGGVRKKATQEEKEAALVGRINTQSLRSMLEDRLLNKNADLKKLAKNYGADSAVLLRTLQYCDLAAVERAADGRLVAQKLTK